MYALDTVHVFCDDFDTLLLLELASYAEHSFEQLFNFHFEYLSFTTSTEEG